jgi:hypothetical protein
MVSHALGLISEALTSAVAPDPATALGGVLERLLPAVQGARWASITSCHSTDDQPSTAAATARPALDADVIQYASGQGPSLEASQGVVVLAGDAELASRWPDFAYEARRATPVRAVLSHPVPAPAEPAAVNFYGDDPAALTAAAVPAAAVGASVVGVALAGLAARSRADNLQVALTSSRQMGAAIGIVMARSRCTYEQAFADIRAVSQRAHRKMRDLAEDVILTGALPDLPAPQRDADVSAAG